MKLTDYKETVYTVPSNGDQSLKIALSDKTQTLTISESIWEIEIDFLLDANSAQLLADVFAEIAKTVKAAN